MKKSIKETGITLIALVVTIIILLILAGVTIGMVTNGTGLFEKAKLATDEYNNSVQKENTELAKVSNEIYDYIEGNRDIKPTLLWENETPNSNFAAQTISIDLSAYNYVLIIIKGNEYDYTPRETVLIPVGEYTRDSVLHGLGTSAYRTARAVKNGVIFSDSSNTNGQYNNTSIPLYIYGIKGDLGIANNIG